MSANAAFILGGALALSSSAFVIQLLSEKGELASRFGRASFGMLLFQATHSYPPATFNQLRC